MTFETLRAVPASELREGDWPVSLAGYRPIQRIVDRPRKRQRVVHVGGDRHTLHHSDVVGRVRRPVAAVESVRTFDPYAAQVR